MVSALGPRQLQFGQRPVLIDRERGARRRAAAVDGGCPAHGAVQSRATLSRVEELVSPLPVPDRPEHHYRYDPPKAQFYVATTLSWLGDTAAEGIAR